uniref:BPTI/Kunitz inhibitor domain-containing protein n=1 Tax=Podarcis muralis TaxID=64176 RepID=A0A670K922_PODMU
MPINLKYCVQCLHFTWGRGLATQQVLDSQMSHLQTERPAKCKLRPRYGRCLSVYRNFYFDTVSGRCMTFIYSGCGGNNNFISYLEWHLGQMGVFLNVL